MRELKTYNLEVAEMRVNVTVASELGRRSTPARWVRATAGDVGWYTRVGEDPNTDGITGPLSRVNTTTLVVESISIGTGARASNGTASIFRLLSGLDVAVTGLDGTTETGVLNRATIAGVQSHLVDRLVIDTFDDVNLAVARPVGAEHPT